MPTAVGILLQGDAEETMRHQAPIVLYKESVEVTFPKSHSHQDYNSGMVLYPTLRAVSQDIWPCEDSFVS